MKKLLALVLIAVLCLGVLISCGGNSDLEGAKEYLDTIMKPRAEKTPADYDVLAQVKVGDVTFPVEWSVDVTEGVKVVVGEDGKVTIDVDEKTATDIAYVLTATIKDEKGNTVTTSYNRIVPAFKELTHAEFTATADDEAVVIKGIITGIVNTTAKHELYLQDKDGGYYVYNIDADKIKDLKIGQEIRVSGIRDTYYGVNQIVEASVEVLNATPAPVAATDITEAIKAAANLKDASLTKYQSMLVKITAADVLGQDANDATYYNFAVGDKVSYVRISGSANMLTAAETTQFEKNVEDNIGKSATVTGLVSIYNNQIYIIPVTVDAFADFAVVERTPAEQVEYEKKFMAAVGDITESGTVTLNTTPILYEDVVITWALTATEYATLEGDKLTVAVLPDEAQTITLTATITSGEASTTKEFTVKINAAPTIIGEVVALPQVGTAYKFMVKQNKIKQTLYFAGSINDKGYLETTTNPEKAVDVYLEAVEGKEGEYYFYYMVGESGKAYVTVADVNGKKSVTYARQGSNTYKYDAERGALTTTVTIGDTEKTYYFGTYNNYDTIGTSETSYIEDKSVIGNTQFVANFATMIDTTKVSDADKVAKEKENLDITTSFGAQGGSYQLPITGTTFAKVTFTWAVEENGGALAIVDGKLVATPQAAETTVKVTATIAVGEATDTKEFNVTVAAIPTKVPVKVSGVEVGKEYLLGIYQANLEMTIFFEGTPDYKTYYFGSTSEYADAVKVILEAGPEDGTYYAYIMKDGAKKYLGIEIGDHKNPKLHDTATTAFTFDATLCTLVYTDDAGSYTFGTYSNYDSIGANSLGNETTFYSALYEMKDASSVSDADKVAEEKLTLNVETEYAEATTVTLPVKGTKYEDVVISWAVSENALVTVNGGTLTITLPAIDTENVVVTLTATITVGEATDTKVFNLTIVAPTSEVLTVTGALALDKGAKVNVKGEVVNVTAWNTENNNMSAVISDGTNIILCYRLATQVGVGDVITVKGEIDEYKGTKQIAAGATATIDYDAVTLTEAIALPDDTAVVVTGTVTKIDYSWSDTNKNMSVTITDDEGNTLYIYKLATKVELNDYIVVTGIVGSYKGAKQIAAGATAVVKEKCAYLSFDNTSNRTTLTTTQQVWEQNGVKVTGDKDSSTTDVKDYSAPSRFYQGAKFTLEYTGMKKIVFNVDNSEGGKYFTNFTASLDAAGITYTVSGSAVTVELTEATNSIVFSCSGQIRLYSIEVYD